MSEQGERHGDAAAVFECLKYHASAGGEYEYRGTLAIEAFDRICTTLLDLQAQRDELLAVAKEMAEQVALLPASDGRILGLLLVLCKLRAAIANAEKEERCPTTR